MATKTKNIGGTDKDLYYRYKRPELKTKVEKPGTNGVKTVIENMSAIAKALQVPPEYPTRFLGYELCTQATYEDSTDRTCTVVKGKHTVQDLDKALDEFITKFILCPRCKLPETKISVKKGQVKINCNGCGHAGPLTTGHRLENYISKNPPHKKKADGLRGHKKDDEEKEDSPTEPESQKLDEKEDDWSLDTSEEAQKARRAEFLETQVSSNKIQAESEKKNRLSQTESEKPETILTKFMKENTDVVAISAELDRLQLKHGLSPEERYRILLTSAIDVTSPKTLATQFAKQAPLFKRVLKEKSAGVLFITSIERLLDSASPKGEERGKGEDLKSNLVNRIPVVLQKLYELDVLDEGTILAWAQSPPDTSAWAVGKDVAAYARRCTKPFVEWLQSAEEEDDDK